MAFVLGQVTGTKALASIISEIAIGTSLESVDSIAAAGTGYAVGDEIRIQGGDFLVRATVEVTSVGGSGDVTGVRITNAGLYSTVPTDPVTTASDDGSGCTLNLTFSANGWERLRATNVAGAASSATINAAGTGYSVDDVLTLSGGEVNVAATFRVTSVGGSGEVTGIELVEQGSYHVTPSDPVSTTGGGGSGCTLDVTFGGSGDSEIIMVGEGDAGADEIYVGIQTDTTGTSEQLFLAGFTGFNADLPWASQPGKSPGAIGSDDNPFCPTHNLAIAYWVSVTPRRILFAYRAVTFYGSGHLGFLNPYLTGNEWSYPMYIAACSSEDEGGFAPDQTFCYVGNPTRNGPGGNGSALVRTPVGWEAVANSDDNDEVSDGTNYVWPYAAGPSYSGNGSTAVAASTATAQWSGSAGSPANTAFSPVGTPAGSPGLNIHPTPNSGGDLYLKVPCVVYKRPSNQSGLIIYGEIDGVFAINSGGVLIPENRLVEDDIAYLILGGGNDTGTKGLWAFREN